MIRLLHRLQDTLYLYRAFRRAWPTDPRSCSLRLAWSIAQTLQQICDEQAREHTP
jgi:hypothetical protein